MKILPNISRREVACNDGCGFDTIDFETARIVQQACDHFSRKLRKKVTLDIFSGCRCPPWNIHEGGAEDSEHLRARALDHKIREVSVAELAQYYRDRYPGKYGIGEYENFVHLDTRTIGPARW